MRGSIRQRARELVIAGKVAIRHHVEDRVIALVLSTSDPDLAHTVIWEPHEWRCSCEAGQHRKPCVHTEAARLELARRGRQTRLNRHQPQ